MKLHEITDDEPLLAKVMKQHLAKGGTIIYNRIDDDYYDDHPKHKVRFTAVKIGRIVDDPTDGDGNGTRTVIEWRSAAGKTLHTFIPDELVHRWSLRKVADNTWEYYRVTE